jgi:hypothetical protein
MQLQFKKKIERKINIEDSDSWIKGYLKKDREIGYLKIQRLPIRCNKIIVLVFNNNNKNLITMRKTLSNK